MKAEEFTARINALNPEQQTLMRSMIGELIEIIEGPPLPAIMLRMLPSPVDSRFATVAAFCISGCPEHATAMLAAFLTAHDTVLQAAEEATDQPRH